MPSNPHARSLRALARAYLGEARAIGYDDLCTRQEPPFASVAFGATGVATAFARAGSPDLDEASRWLAEVKPDAADEEHSMHYGPAGRDLVAALVARARGDSRARAAAARSFVRRAQGASAGSSEVLRGSAGFLNGLVLLGDATGAAAMADVLANDLLARARGPVGWMRAADLGFAHGRAGIFHALLGWAHARARELPAWLLRSVSAFEADLDRRGDPPAAARMPRALVDQVHRSFCNGATGFVLLWARAFEVTGDEAHRAAARRGARRLLTHVDARSSDLCCGLGGRAYALLAMDRIEPDHGWHERALTMTTAAARGMLASAGAWPNGLYKGFPGLVCLVSDVLARPARRVGFPLIEG